jgi:hypothetical protein
MLTGSELLAKVEKMGDAGTSGVVRARCCGSSKKKAGEPLRFTVFCEALLDAKAVELGAFPPMARARRKLRDVAPGQGLEIKLGRKQILLLPAGASEDHEA